MSDEQVGYVVGLVIFGAAFLDGIRNTRELRRTHEDEQPPRNRITFAFYAVAAVITAFAGIIGGLTLRALLGFERLPFAPFLVLGLVIAVLFIPRYLRMTVDRIRRGAA